MKQTLRIQFEEQAKGVVANVDLTVEQEAEFVDPAASNRILEETKRIFTDAQAYAHTKTLQKNR